MTQYDANHTTKSRVSQRKTKEKLYDSYHFTSLFHDNS